MLDLVVAPLVRHVPGDTRVRLAAGVEAELLFGRSEWRPPRLPFRLGPFASVTAQLGGATGAQVALGATALVRGRSSGDGFGTAWRISAGALGDLDPDLPDRWGALARLAVGASTVGERVWKPVSVGFFLEGHWIPDPDGARQEVLLGLRMSPLAFPFILVPGAGDL